MKHIMFQPVIIALLLLASCSKGGAERAFSSETWKAHADGTTAARAEMLPSLEKAHRLKGMKREALEALLGPPTPTDKFGDWDAAYVLGPQGYGVDHQWLLIRFEGQQVAETRTAAD